MNTKKFFDLVVLMVSLIVFGVWCYITTCPRRLCFCLCFAYLVQVVIWEFFRVGSVPLLVIKHARRTYTKTGKKHAYN